MTLASGIRLTSRIDPDANPDPGYRLIRAPHVGLDKIMLDRFLHAAGNDHIKSRIRIDLDHSFRYLQLVCS